MKCCTELEQQEMGTLAGALVDDSDNREGQGRAGQPDTGAALAMLDVFASVGATAFDVSITDIDQNPVEGLQRRRESIWTLRRRIARDLQDGASNQHSVIIRPRSTRALLVQLDDFTPEQAVKIERHSFMTITTSPGNCQVWIAVSDGPKDPDESRPARTDEEKALRARQREAAKVFRTRVRRGTGADHSATGATRIAGSINFKTKYAPEFPVVSITSAHPGSMTTVAVLELAGLVAPREQTQPPPASVPRAKSSPPGRVVTGPRNWPDWHDALRRQSPAYWKSDGTPDRSLVDFMFAKWAIERGNSIEATAERLGEVSPKAQEQIRSGDTGYTLLTARNAVKAVERDRNRRQFVKSTPAPSRRDFH